MSWDREFDKAFRPQSIAFVGASPQDAERVQQGGAGGGTLAFLRHCLDLGYAGRAYPINPRAAGQEVWGLRVYGSVSDLPEIPDLVIVGVPRQFVPDVLRDCARKGARNVHVYTAGFEETAEEDARKLAAETRALVREHRLNLVGPNCMGLAYIPRAKVATWPGFTGEPGNVALVGQSGGLASDFPHSGEDLGLRFSKVVSYGNAYGFDAADYLEYLADDPDTGVVTMYLEGVRDGRRLLEMARRVSLRKPLVIWKGGLTEAGARAVASHTASLAGSAALWRAFFRQTGAIPVQTLEEMLDVTLALTKLPRLHGGRVAALVSGGGVSVGTADVLTSSGLEVPPISQAAQDGLSALVPPVNTSVRNPVDAGALVRDSQTLEKALRVVSEDSGIDIILVSLLSFIIAPYPALAAKQAEDVSAFLSKAASEGRLAKPVVPILVHNNKSNDLDPIRLAARNTLVRGGLPVYYSVARASGAVGKALSYWNWRTAVEKE